MRYVIYVTLVNQKELYSCCISDSFEKEGESN